jgi:hypothetical protein
MKKFKLIREYPGSPKLGTIVKGKFLGHYHDISEQISSITSNLIENQPEFWEEVVEKDYKIISYIAKDNPTHITTKRRGAHLHEYYWKINSVKRLEDDVIFTIGDKINRGACKDVNVIRGFNLLKDLCLVSISDLIDRGYLDGKGVNISVVKHAKNVLFTALDGVDIYEGDKCYAVSDNFNILYTSYVPNDYQKQGIVRSFSTHEKAEEYVIMNKPCLSINDLKSWGVISVDTLVKIVKTKI